MGEGATPSEGVSRGSGWLANRVTSVKEGRKRVSFGLCVFSGSFGVRIIVLCKCSGKYIDIYFILKITFYAGERSMETFFLFFFRNLIELFLRTMKKNKKSG